MAGFKYEPHLENAVWAGRYFDGTSPVPHPVQARPKDGGLLLSDPATGDVIRHCTGESIKLLNFSENERRVDLALRGEDGVRLSFEGISVRTQMARHIPQVGGHIPEMGASAGFKVVSFLIAFMAVAGVFIWQFQRILPELLPDSYVHIMGESTVELVHNIFGDTCTVEEGNVALNQMVKKIGGDVDFGYDLAVEVVDSNLVNALAAPGGRIIIFRGLIDKADSSEEVAGVLAHEMGHVLNKHSLQRLAQTMGMDLVIALLGGGNLGNMSQQLILMSFSREAESQADQSSIDLLQAADVSTEGVAEFFGRISRKHNNKTSSRGWNSMKNFVATHPASNERAALYKGAIQDSSPVMSDEAWQALKNICKKPAAEVDTDIDDDTDESEHDPAS